MMAIAMASGLEGDGWWVVGGGGGEWGGSTSWGGICKLFKSLFRSLKFKLSMPEANILNDLWRGYISHHLNLKFSGGKIDPRGASLQRKPTTTTHNLPQPQ